MKSDLLLCRNTQKISKEGSGAGGRNRTDTRLPSQDFESCASTNFTTPALYFSIIYGGNCYLYMNAHITFQDYIKNDSKMDH